MRELQERTPASTARPRVLLLCSPCMGHLIPFAELARPLVADHGLAATLLFAAATSPPSEQYLAVAAAAPDGVDLVALPAPPPDALAPSASIRARAAHAVVFSVPRVRELARSLAAAAPPLVAVVVDMVGIPARHVATELGVPSYVFFTSPWMTLSLFLHLPELDAARAGEHWDAKEPICLPGYVPIHAHELPRSMLADRRSETYTGLLSMAKDFRLADGILVNTFSELEPAVVDAMGGTEPPVHPVGPLIWTRPAGMDRDHECLRWLDRQPQGSVVYVSFGSGGTLTWQQTAELALGLELSQHRFLWAVKRPCQDTASGAFFGYGQGEDTSLEYLPEGFMERTRGRGLMIQSWAPQTSILAHASLGCFVTHCGWNSALESITNGVPMVAWPLFAEQHMNASMLEAQVGVAIRIKDKDGQLISKEEVASVVQRVMAGAEAERMRQRASELREKSVHALSKDGSSARALEKITDTWKCVNSLPV